MRSPTNQPKIIHHRPIEELADSVQESWKSVCECTARFLREVYEFDLRQGYKEWGYVDTAELLEFALKTPASFLEKRLAELRNGSSEGSSDSAHLDRKLWSCERDGDRVEIRANLSRADAMLVLEALEKCKSEIAESGLENDGKWDDLARSADALVLMARRSLSGRFRGIEGSDEHPDPEPRDSAESPEPSGSGHLVMVHVDESALRGKGGASDLPIRTVKRLLCDGPAVGIVENGNGEPLSIGRKSRTVPTAIRRALDGRDRTCRFPGCSHTKWLDAHHIRHWTDGGETSLENLVLLCTHHHRLLHEGGFQMLPREGGSYYFGKRDGRPVELAEGQTLAEGEEAWALRPWREGRDRLCSEHSHA